MRQAKAGSQCLSPNGPGSACTQPPRSGDVQGLFTIFTKCQDIRFWAHPGNMTIAGPLLVSLSINLGPDVCVFFLPGGCAGVGSSEMGTQGPAQQRPLRI